MSFPKSSNFLAVAMRGFSCWTWLERSKSFAACLDSSYCQGIVSFAGQNTFTTGDFLSSIPKHGIGHICGYENMLGMLPSKVVNKGAQKKVVNVTIYRGTCKWFITSYSSQRQVSWHWTFWHSKMHWERLVGFRRVSFKVWGGFSWACTANMEAGHTSLKDCESISYACCPPR